MSFEKALNLLNRLGNDIDYFRELSKLNNKDRIQTIKEDGYFGFNETEYMAALVKTIIQAEEPKYQYRNDESDSSITSKTILPMYDAFDPAIEFSPMQVIGENISMKVVEENVYDTVEIDKQ